MRPTLYLLLTLFLTSCRRSFPPVEVEPMQTKDNWHALERCENNSSGPTPLSLACTENFNWWCALQDPLLTHLLSEACDQNLDLAIAKNRIATARLMKKGKEADRLPHLDGSLAAGRFFGSKEILTSGLFGKTHGLKRNIAFFEAGFDADWEIDFFGRTQSELHAAQAEIESQEANFQSVWVSLSAEIGKNYIELRSAQARSALLCEKIALAQEKINLISDLEEEGTKNYLNLLQAKSALHSLLAEEPLLDLSIQKSIYHLAILVGKNPGDLFDELARPAPLPLIPSDMPIGIPSELLRRRPDIRAKERELAKALQEVETAIAELFPRFSLFGFIGQVSSHLAGLPSGNSTTYLPAGALLFPLFNSKLLQRDVSLSKIQAQEALLSYQKTVLNALEETELSIASLRGYQKVEDEIKNIEAIASEVMALNEDLYQKGFEDYLEVLNSKEAHIQSQERLLLSTQDRLISYIALYKSLGGSFCSCPCDYTDTDQKR